MRTLWRISRRAAKYKGRMLLAYLSVLGVTAFAMMVPPILGTVVDAILPTDGVISPNAANHLLFLALAILVVFALRGVCAYGQTYLGESLGQRVAYDLRNEFYDHVQRMSFAYHDKEQTGNLMSKATSDVEGIRMFIQAGLIRSVYMITLMLSVGVVMFLMNWQLAILSMVFVPIVVWRGARLTLSLRREWLAVQTEMGHMNTVLQENLAGQRVVKAFAAENHEQDRFGHRAGNVARHSYRAAIYQASNTGMMTFYYIGATILILWAGGRQVPETLTAGELAQFIFYLGLLAMPVRMAAWVVNSFSRGMSAGQRLFATLDTESPVQEKASARALPRARGHVRFEDVSFGYDDAVPVLKHISFEAEPAQVIALVGAPGSGKTTIVHLLPRFYDVTSGRVTVDSIDVKDVTMASLRANIGIVQQDVFLFTSTVRENIAYGVVDASFDRIVQAAKIAQLHDFITTLPEGYDTWVGERGTTLSGGQRQRMAIARTALLDPAILVLDDSTSSVDTETEKLIRQGLVDVMKGRTTFVIAHRLSTVKNADLVLMLKDGEIVQRGTHQELLNQLGPYREIYELQLRPQEALTDEAQAQDQKPDVTLAGHVAGSGENK